MQYTILILVKASNQWLSMPRIDRDLFVENELRPILAKFSDTCRIQLFDSDFTNADVSDFIIVETTDLVKYGYLIGYLRESKAFAIPYFEVKNVIIGVPNNFRGSMDVADITKNNT